MTGFIQTTLTQTPNLTPRKGGILDAFGVIDTASMGSTNPDGMFESLACMVPETSDLWCGKPGSAKDIFSPTWADEYRFSAYALVDCGTVGFDFDEAEPKMRQAWTLSESRTIEQGFAEQFLSSTNVVDLSTTYGSALDPKTALAILEGYAATHYTARAVLHVGVDFASLLLADSLIEFSGNVAYTKLGTKVVIGAGYTNALSPSSPATPAPEGTRWAFVTGELLIRGGPLQMKPAVDQYLNRVNVLAERAYGVTVDCLAAALNVRVFPEF